MWLNCTPYLLSKALNERAIKEDYSAVNLSVSVKFNIGKESTKYSLKLIKLFLQKITRSHFQVSTISAINSFISLPRV